MKCFPSVPLLLILIWTAPVTLAEAPPAPRDKSASAESRFTEALALITKPGEHRTPKEDEAMMAAVEVLAEKWYAEPSKEGRSRMANENVGQFYECRVNAVTVNDKKLWLLSLRHPGMSVPGIEAVSELLLSPEGALLDRLDCIINCRYGGLKTEILEKPVDDEAIAVIQFVPQHPKVSTWHNWHNILFRGQKYEFSESEQDTASPWISKGLCRLVVTETGFAVPWPDLPGNARENLPRRHKAVIEAAFRRMGERVGKLADEYSELTPVKAARWPVVTMGPPVSMYVLYTDSKTKESTDTGPVQLKIVDTTKQTTSKIESRVYRDLKWDGKAGKRVFGLADTDWLVTLEVTVTKPQAQIEAIFDEEFGTALGELTKASASTQPADPSTHTTLPSPH